MTDTVRKHTLANSLLTRAVPRLTISQSELFRRWPVEDLDPLIAAADVIQLESGELLHAAGDMAEYLYLLAAGSMRVSTRSTSGREFTTRMYFAGDYHGLGPVLTGANYVYTVSARSQTLLVRIPRKLLVDMLSRDGRLAIALCVALSDRHLRTVARYAEASTGSIRARVAGLLESFLERAPRQPATEVHLMQVEIAELLGTRRQGINRELRALEMLGMLRLEYGYITVIDRDALRALAYGMLNEPE